MRSAGGVEGLLSSTVNSSILFTTQSCAGPALANCVVGKVGNPKQAYSRFGRSISMSTKCKAAVARCALRYLSAQVARPAKSLGVSGSVSLASMASNAARAVGDKCLYATRAVTSWPRSPQAWACELPNAAKAAKVRKIRVKEPVLSILRAPGSLRDFGHLPKDDDPAFFPIT